jgi:3-methylcrotonyl-CoA carboxylase alpha subunit
MASSSDSRQPTAHSFDSILIANRGEIAVRIIRACREAGLRSVAVYSDADEAALHVRLADEAHRIGPPPAAQSYLNARTVLEAAQRSGAQALHPGYGFLAEDASFAQLCQQAGLVWIGPPPAAMQLLGDKAAAKALADKVGVPTLPGYHGEAQNHATLRAGAERIGFPVLVKAAAGGGGRGMRLVATRGELDEALQAARREARAAFGDDRLLLERYLERPRHVEIQIFGDAHGNVVYLGERDCSIQRRHQKVIEEAPAPNFSEARRRDMGEAAVKLARAAGYENAGTVEFLLDQDGSFYFLEVNTRLQVEHPVTEMVTGLDLVRLQFQVAAGATLPLTQSQVRIDGHAIEARLYAEDPINAFLPSSGRLERFKLPCPDAGVRVDSGVRAGDSVSAFYDPLLAKIVTHAADRNSALDQMAAALAGVAVAGVQTNVELLQDIVAADDFADSRLHTGFLDEQGLSRGPLPPPAEFLMAAAVHEALSGQQSQDQCGNPWRHAGPWRVAWVGAEVRYRHATGLYRVAFVPPLQPDEPWRFRFPDSSVEEYTVQSGPFEIVLQRRDAARRFLVSRDGQARSVTEGRRQLRLQLDSGLEPGASQAARAAEPHHEVIRAPMPGRVARVAAKVGDEVKANQTLLVLEAMKIEHLVTTPHDGVVEAVRYKEGDQVERGAELIELED